MELENFPDEILSNCLIYLKDFKEDIKNLRLVSKRLHEVSSELLIQSAQVFIGSESLLRFEELSRHPIFCKSIRTVEFDLRYFDVRIATNREIFLSKARSVLIEGGNARSTRAESNAINDVDFDEEKATENQRYLLAAYHEYRRRYLDQEQAIQQQAYIFKIRTALMRMSNVSSIVLDNKSSHWGEPSPWTKTAGYEIHRKDLAKILGGHSWTGSWAGLTSVPALNGIIPGIFQALNQASTKPLSFTIRMRLWAHLQGLQLTEAQSQTVRTVLSHVHTLICHMRCFVVDPLSEEALMFQPPEGATAFKTLAATFFALPSLTALRLMFQEAYRLGGNPKVCLSDFLPTSGSWPQLRILFLKDLLFSLRDLRILVKFLRHALQTFTGYWLHLQSGAWSDALDIVRGFDILQDFEILYCSDGEESDLDLPGDVIADYVTRKTELNPLRDPQLQDLQYQLEVT